MKVFNWKDRIKPEELEEVIDKLKNDGIIIFPTDTVYGIGCNCFSERAIKKTFDIKLRAEKKPINVLTDQRDKINKVAKKISEKEDNIINSYMPGALTIVLDKKDIVPNILTSGLDTVGVRIPNNEIALRILENFEVPIATTSANISGDLPGLEIQDFVEKFKDKVDIIIDGGKCKIGTASTIVRVDKRNQINVLRKGSIDII